MRISLRAEIRGQELFAGVASLLPEHRVAASTHYHLPDSEVVVTGEAP
jgi:hypothetical protein